MNKCGNTYCLCMGYCNKPPYGWDKATTWFTPSVERQFVVVYEHGPCLDFVEETEGGWWVWTDDIEDATLYSELGAYKKLAECYEVGVSEPQNLKVRCVELQTKTERRIVE